MVRPFRPSLLSAFITTLVLCLGLATPGHAATPPAPSARTVVDLDHGWRFHKGDVAGAEAPGYDDSGWQSVSVPHTWNARDGEDGGNDYHRGPGWYRRTVRIPAGRVFLQFDGATIVSDVWVNGRKAGHHAGGYAAFRFDVTGLAAPGTDATIAVRVDNSGGADVLPLGGDFTVFGGLTRDVHLLVTDPVHVDALDYGGPGVYVRQTVNGVQTKGAVRAASADLAVTTRVANDTAAPVRAKVRTVITDAAHRTVATASGRVDVGPGAVVPVVQNASVADPRLWNGRPDPYLYTVRTEVSYGGHTDVVTVPLGIRTVAVDTNRGFLLNGRPYAVHGVDLHGMRAGEGSAMSASDVDQDFGLIDRLGATGVRLVHYQHGQRIYDLADRRGIILWTEIPNLASITVSDAFFANARQQLLELIRQNEQHAAVAVWGIGNELYTSSADANRLLGDLAATVKAEDPSRPSTYATCCFSDTDPIANHSETIGYNRYFGWYGGSFSDIGPWADGLHAQDPARKIAVSEYGAGASVVEQQTNPAAPVPASHFHPEEWQARYHEENWRQLRSRPYLWGTFVWQMFDSAVDGRDEGDRPGLNDKGLVTADRKIAKDAYYWYQANWSSTPVVRIAQRRDTPRFTPATDVKVYANTRSVNLSLNGVPLGSRAPEDHIATWSGVTLKPGANVIEARSGGTTDRVTWLLDTSTGATTVDAEATDPHASDGRVFRKAGRAYREGTFAYRFPVADGTYDVDLTFAEPDRSGQRSFNVNAERQRVIKSLDVRAESGVGAPLHKTFTVQVTDGVLDLEFVPQVGEAVVSHITAIRRSGQ
ncbi:hypothetical protein GCM10023196_064920 [Actinoallomurus vinaceus]|uniref:Beta-galactosidase n=1 Tax=Actinoallomurus vinaceus TaxID=1080074 RepID=A0ABP8UHE5_9ACTN